MKKIYISFLIFSAIAVSAFGQEKISGTVNAVSVSSNSILKSENPTVMAIDTLWPPSFGMPFQCDTAAVYYNWQAPATGYVFGNNSYGELECAQKYYATGTVNEVLMYGDATGTTGSTTVKLYSINPTTKGPSATVLGTSAVVPTGSISTTLFTSYIFTPAVTVTNQFAAAVVFPTTAGDTVVVISTKLGCSTSDSLSWMNFPNYGGWRCTPSIISGKPNADLYIMPVGTLSANGINEYSANGLSLLGAYPNPANDFTTIRYTINEQTSVSVKVFDLTGRVIHHSSEKLSAGTHTKKLSLSVLPAGNYYYTITTGDAQLTSKFVVAK